MGVRVDVDLAHIGYQKDYSLFQDDGVKNDKIIVHYNGGALAKAYSGPAAERDMILDIERFHLSKGWSGIAYGFIIGMSGKVYEARGENCRYAAHRGDLDKDGISENLEGVPVMLLIGGNQRPSGAALIAFDRVMGDLGDLPVFGHRDVDKLGTGGTATACPGAVIYQMVVNPPKTVFRDVTSLPSMYTSMPESQPMLRVRRRRFSRRLIWRYPTQVMWVQKMVGAKADGKYGPATSSLVRKYQTDHGLLADGIVGAITWRSLSWAARRRVI